MKNKARPLSVERLQRIGNSTLHYKYGFRAFYNNWIRWNIFSYKKMNQLNDDGN